MQHATLTIMGLYHWDETIFDNLVLPEGMDRDMQVGNILMECAELEILYNNPTTFKQMLGIWSNMRLWNWTELYKTLFYDYDPIENYDRKEDWTDHGSHNETTDSTENETSDRGTTNNVTRDITIADTDVTDTTGTKNTSQDTTTDTTGKEVVAGSSEGKQVTDANSSSTVEEKESGNTTSNNTETLNTKVGVVRSYHDDSHTTTEGSDTETVSAFNSSSWANKDKHDTTGSTTVDNEGSSNENTTNTGTIKNEGDGTSSSTRNGTSSGNDNSTVNSTSSEDRTTDTTGKQTGKVTGTESDVGNVDRKYNRTQGETEVGKADEKATVDRTKGDKTKGENWATRVGRAHGNIGVTTTQEMIQEQRDIVMFNIYEHITREFKEQFCVLIY